MVRAQQVVKVAVRQKDGLGMKSQTGNRLVQRGNIVAGDR